MSEPNEPDRYSLDEMLERLKHRAPEPKPGDGELVTREDGSQLIKVRRRKRRSHQPHKEAIRKKRRMHAIQIAASLILLLIFIFGAGLAVIFANSGFFRKGLMEKIAAASGAEVRLEQFRMNPTGADAALIEMVWPESSALKKLFARGLSAKVHPKSFLGVSMTGDEVVAQDATLYLGAPLVQDGAKANVPEAAPAIFFDRLAATKCQVIFGDAHAPDFRLKDSEVSLFPGANDPVLLEDLEDNGTSWIPNDETPLREMIANRADSTDREKYFPTAGKAVPRLLINRGELAMKGWPNFQLDRAQMEFVDRMVNVIGLRLRSQKDTRGVLEFSGRIFPYSENQTSRLSASAQNFPLEEIAGAELGKLFSGGIESDPAAGANELLLAPGADAFASLTLSFRSAPSSSFVLHGLPCLKILSNVLNDDWFEQPVFLGDVIGTIRREGAEVAITDLDLQSRERMAIRGSVRYGRERAFAGTLEIGVAQTVIKASGNRRLDMIFGPPKGNFRWLSLKIGGTAVSPTDDFEAIYDAASRGGAGGAPEGKAPSFEDLTRPE